MRVSNNSGKLSFSRQNYYLVYERPSLWIKVSLLAVQCFCYYFSYQCRFIDNTLHYNITIMDILPEITIKSIEKTLLPLIQQVSFHRTAQLLSFPVSILSAPKFIQFFIDLNPMV